MENIQDQLLRALEARYSFPGFYPVVVIARSDESLRARILAAVAYAQDGREFTVGTRESGGGKYTSFKLELFVDSAEQALARKEFLNTLEGVMMIL